MVNSTSDSRQAYNQWHQRFEVDSDSDAPWHQMLKARLDPGRDVAGKRLLEIGCGRGGFACWLATRPAAPGVVVAADFAAAAVEKGRSFASQRGISAISWEVGDIQEIGHATNSFDTVISCETIEHVPDPARAVRELARVLKPGGRLFLTTPNYMGVYGLYRIYLRLTGRRYTEENQPINNFMMLPRTRAMMVAAGLRVEVAETAGHYRLRPGRVPTRIPHLDQSPFLKPFGLHSLLVAQKDER